MEVRQKLTILSEDFVDAVRILTDKGPSISRSQFIEQSAILDYAKNSAVTLLNAVVLQEKSGDFQLGNQSYQSVRLKAIALTQNAIHAYYAHLIGNEKDYVNGMKNLLESHMEIVTVRDHLESEYRHGAFSSRYFTRPEAGHPLVIAASAYLTSRDAVPATDTILGLPAGGTEVAFAHQYAYQTLQNRRPELVLIPLSLHSGKDLGIGTHALEPFIKFLQSNDCRLRGKNVLIVEDNSSTGKTIQLLCDMLSDQFGIRHINVSVAEADVIRSQIDHAAEHRTHFAAPKAYMFSVNVLPVSNAVRPKVDLKEIAETKRLKLSTVES